MRDRKLLTLSYMKNFRCLGPECEDICCQGWRIPMDREDVGRLEELRAKSPLVDRLFDQAVVADPANQSHAVMGFGANGHCLFEQGGLCALHAQFGEEVLPKTCATYPRIVLRQDQNFLLSGSLSCPEVARLCLLHEDAMVVEEAPSDLLPPRIDRIEDHTPPITMAVLQAMRGAVIGLLADPRWPLANANYLVAYLARKLDAIQANDAQYVQRVESMIAKLLDPDHQGRLLRNLGDPPDTEVPRRFLGLVLGAKANHANSVRYNHLVAQILNGYGLVSTAVDEAALVQLWPAHLARVQALTRRFGARLERYFRNYGLNYWQQVRLGQVGNLSVDVRQFALSFAVVKFLVLAHPESAALATLDEVDAAALEQLDRIAVAAVQTFSRNISHNAGMLAYLGSLMERGGLLDVSELYSLLCL